MLTPWARSTEAGQLHGAPRSTHRKSIAWLLKAPGTLGKENLQPTFFRVTGSIVTAGRVGVADTGKRTRQSTGGYRKLMGLRIPPPRLTFSPTELYSSDCRMWEIFLNQRKYSVELSDEAYARLIAQWKREGREIKEFAHENERTGYRVGGPRLRVLVTPDPPWPPDSAIS